MKSISTNWEILQEFRTVDTSKFPEFGEYDKPLERGMWILWVVKDKLRINRLSADKIAYLIVHAMEVSVSARAVTNAFNKTKDKKMIHTYKESGGIFYEIMKPGKQHLTSQTSLGGVKLHYFEPGKKHTSKRILRESILDELKGELKIVEPYCDSGTLDILSKSKSRKIECLTRIENLRQKAKESFLRDLRDFKSECSDIEFRNYSKSDIHDRYIISRDKLIILGYSLKDLGSKESFAIILDKKTAHDIFDTLVGTFNRRWKVASQL